MVRVETRVGASVVSEGLTSVAVPAIVRNLELPKLLNYESLMIYYNGLILSLNLKSERNIASYSGTHEGSRLRTQDLGPRTKKHLHYPELQISNSNNFF